MVTGFKFNKNEIASLEKQMNRGLAKVEKEADKVASRESTPQKKARAVAKVLRAHGVENVNESDLRRQFDG